MAKPGICHCKYHFRNAWQIRYNMIWYEVLSGNLWLKPFRPTVQKNLLLGRIWPAELRLPIPRLEYHVVSDHYRLFFWSGLIMVKLKRRSIKLLTIASAFKCNEENIPSSRSTETIKSRFELWTQFEIQLHRTWSFYFSSQNCLI